MVMPYKDVGFDHVSVVYNISQYFKLPIKQKGLKRLRKQERNY